MITLTEFVEANAKPTCSVCKLPTPILQQVEAGWANGLRATPIQRWLETEVGVPSITDNIINKHFSRRHYLRG